VPPEQTKPDESRQARSSDMPAGSKVSVLLVDDQPANLMALEALLGDMGLDLVRASSGLEALRHPLRQDFALILLDVQMPGMDGFEAATLIRQRPRSQHTPIIFLTAYEVEDRQMFRGYAVGAVDYLRKPLVPAVLRSKVAVFVDIFHKNEEVKRQAELLHQLEQREYERQLAAARERLEHERMQQEIRIAREIQQKLFPAAPLPLPGFDVSGASCPAEATGGDYFDYIPTRGGNLAVVIGDVSGHGYGPALLMAEARAYMRAFLLAHTDPGEIVTQVNHALAADTPADRFATMILAELDPRTRSLAYVSAGHTAGYVLDPSGAVKATLDSTGFPLAIVPDCTYTSAPPLTLAAGDLVLLVTDGIIEAHSGADDLFGTQRMLEVVRSNRQRSAREIVGALYQAVEEFCGVRAQLDDMTAIVMKVEGGS
jgi:serine phosphatase RsbU (regulator of sigma subunit)